MTGCLFCIREKPCSLAMLFVLCLHVLMRGESVLVCHSEAPDLMWCVAVKCWARGLLNPLFCGCVLQRSKLGRANLTRYLPWSLTVPSGGQVRSCTAPLCWGLAFVSHIVGFIFYFLISLHCSSPLFLLLSLLSFSVSVWSCFDTLLSLFAVFPPPRDLLGISVK